MAEIPALFYQRPIVLKHEKAALYHPFTEALALTLVTIPQTFLITIGDSIFQPLTNLGLRHIPVFGVILYYMVQLQQTAVSLPLHIPDYFLT